MELQFGSDSDQNRGDGFQTADNFPFDFEITLEYDADFELTITDVQKLRFDTSSYYSWLKTKNIANSALEHMAG